VAPAIDVIRLPGFEHRYQHGQETISDTRSARPCLWPTPRNWP
jgi:hypothetical protein